MEQSKYGYNFVKSKCLILRFLYRKSSSWPLCNEYNVKIIYKK